jgi:hypothetical protein
MSFKDSFIRFDVFRKMPKDLTEPTFCGAIGNYLGLLNSYYSVFCLYGHSSDALCWRSAKLLESGYKE